MSSSHEKEETDDDEWAKLAIQYEVADEMTAAPARVLIDAAYHACQNSDNKKQDTTIQVLDVACGPGAVTKLMLERLLSHEAVVHMDATDHSEEMIRLARQRLQSVARDVFCADAMNLPSRLTAKYDLVVSNFGIFLVPDPARALAEARRVLRGGGGVCAITMWENDDWAFDLIKGLVALLDDESLNAELDGILEKLKPMFEVDRYEDMFLQAGFQQVTKLPVDSSSVLPSARAFALAMTCVPFVAKCFESVSTPGAKQDAFLDAAVAMLVEREGYPEPLVARRKSHIILGRL